MLTKNNVEFKNIHAQLGSVRLVYTQIMNSQIQVAKVKNKNK